MIPRSAVSSPWLTVDAPSPTSAPPLRRRSTCRITRCCFSDLQYCRGGKSSRAATYLEASLLSSNARLDLNLIFHHTFALMPTQATVKVVVTTYNRRDWTKVAIDSVLAQTHENVHIVAIDDASTDDTLELLREYERHYSTRFTVIAKAANRGPADSLRLGLEAGPEAPYVAILNDDDVWYPEKLARQLEAFAADPDLGLVFCDAEIMDADGRRTGQLFSELYGRFAFGDAADAFTANRTCASTHVLRADIAARAARTLPDPSAVTDYYFVLVAVGVAAIAGIETPLAAYRLSAGSIQTNHRRMWRDGALTREVAIAQIPELAERLGGRDRVRRTIALRNLDTAVELLHIHRYADAAWHAWRVIRQRQARPIVWLAIHGVRWLVRRNNA